MPLNCKKCGWSQDSFWTEHYNPITVLERAYKATLLTGDLDAPIFGMVHARAWREFIANEMERMAIKVRNMRVRTRTELEELGLDNIVCPDCGLAGLDVD